MSSSYNMTTDCESHYLPLHEYHDDDDDDDTIIKRSPSTSSLYSSYYSSSISYSTSSSYSSSSTTTSSYMDLSYTSRSSDSSASHSSSFFTILPYYPFNALACSSGAIFGFIIQIVAIYAGALSLLLEEQLQEQQHEQHEHDEDDNNNQYLGLSFPLLLLRFSIHVLARIDLIVYAMIWFLFTWIQFRPNNKHCCWRRKSIFYIGMNGLVGIVFGSFASSWIVMNWIMVSNDSPNATTRFIGTFLMDLLLCYTMLLLNDWYDDNEQQQQEEQQDQLSELEQLEQQYHYEQHDQLNYDDHPLSYSNPNNNDAMILTCDAYQQEQEQHEEQLPLLLQQQQQEQQPECIDDIDLEQGLWMVIV